MFQLNKIPAFLALIAVTVSLSWAENCSFEEQTAYCEWATGCSRINNDYSNDGNPCTTNPTDAGCGESCEVKIQNCSDNGKLFVGGTISGGKCTGTQVGGKTGLQGCCRWAETGVCHNIYSSDKDYEEKIEDCTTGSNKWMEGFACVDDVAGTCPTSSASTGSSSSSGGGTSIEYCSWSTGCYAVVNPNDPNDEHPEFTNRENCTENSPNGLFNNSTCSGTPIAGGPSAPKKNQCRDTQDRGLFCGWASGCYRIESSSTKTCEVVLAECPDNRKYWGVNQATLNADDDGGGGLICANIGGQLLYPSSSSGGTVNPGTSSSSSLPAGQYVRCVFATGQYCTSGPFTAAECQGFGGVPSNEACPWTISSSSGGTVNPGTSSSSSLPAGQYARCVFATGQYCTTGPFTATECQGFGGVPSNDACPWTTPIMISKIANANGAQLIKNGVSLQVTQNATLEVFNLSGKRVRKLNFARGDWSVPLSDMAKGLYIVKVSFGSEAKILRVPVK